MLKSIKEWVEFMDFQGWVIISCAIFLVYALMASVIRIL